MEIQQTYRMLKYQEALYKKELDIKKKNYKKFLWKSKTLQ